MMRDKLMKMKGFADMEIYLKEIRPINLQIETNTSVYNALDKAKRRYYMYIQEENKRSLKYLRNFKIIVKAVEHLGGAMFTDDVLVKYEKKEDERVGNTTKRNNKHAKIAKEKMMGLAFIKSAKQNIYSKLMRSIRYQHSLKNNVYPQTIYNAYELLKIHSSAHNKQKHINDNRQGK